MLRAYLSHGVDEWTLLYPFYNDLNFISRSLFDHFAVGGAFMTKTMSKAKAMLENMLQNHSQWHTAKAPHSSTKKVNSMEEVEF
jgi:hypothetical protein